MTKTRTTQSHVTLNNGVTMPAIGLGVYQSAPQDTADAVASALQAGYRHIDTAAAYSNESQVGEGLIKSGIDRSEIFLETKIWMSDYGYDETLHGFEKSARKLGIEQIDLLLLHQPRASEFEKTIAAYQALETLLADGRVRAIGVSNLDASHLDELVSRTDIVPAVNQLEVHPYFTQPETRAANERHGIHTQSWSPIGGSYIYGEAPQNPLDDPVIATIAGARGKTPAQVILRWHLEHGFSAIPKSTRVHRIVENFNVFDFTLTTEEIAAIDALDTGIRGGPTPNFLTVEGVGLTIPD